MMFLIIEEGTTENFIKVHGNSYSENGKHFDNCLLLIFKMFTVFRVTVVLCILFAVFCSE